MQRGLCEKCNKNLPIVNKKYWLCNRCNWERLHPGESYYCHIKYNLPTQSKVINQVSKKKAEIMKLKNKVYREIDTERERICSGCGSRVNPLSHSHIIPVGQNTKFECVKENIVFDCLSMNGNKGCHDIWEHGSMNEKRKLLNFNERMKFIKVNDYQYYCLLMSKLV